MDATPLQDGLHVLLDGEARELDVDEATRSEDGHEALQAPADADLESLRDEFVEAFNARDLDAVLAIVDRDVECPDTKGDGAAALAEELESIWERSPNALLTRGFLDADPVAMAWTPDEDGSWTRAALVCFDAADGLLTLVAVPDDVDAMERAEAEEPIEDELAEWSDWAEWERGEESAASSGSSL